MWFESGLENPIDSTEQQDFTSMLLRLQDFPMYPEKTLDGIFAKTLPPELSFSWKEIMTSLWIHENHEQYESVNELATSIHKVVFDNNTLWKNAGIYSDTPLPLKNMIHFDSDTQQINISDLWWNIIKSFELCSDSNNKISINENGWETLSIADLQFAIDQFGADALGIGSWDAKDQELWLRNHLIYPKEVEMSSLYTGTPQINNIRTYTTAYTHTQAETRSTSDIHIDEGNSITIRSDLLRSSSHTLDTIFAVPKPQELIIQNPWKEEMRVRHDGDGYISHLHNKRPPIYPWVKITNVSHKETTKRVDEEEQIHIPKDKALVLEDVETKKLADIFTNHKNTTFSVDYIYTRRPEKGRTVAIRDDSKGFFVDRAWNYVAIYDGVRIEDLSISQDGIEDSESLTHQNIIDQVQWWCFDANDLWIDASYSTQLQTYMADHFDDNSIHIEDNTSARNDVYIENNMLYFTIDNNGINKSYHKNLSIPLDIILTNQSYDQNKFMTHLWKKITYILDEQYPIYSNTEENEDKYETVKWRTIKTKNTLKYKPKESYKTPTMTYCSRSTREFATNNMWVTFDPVWSAKDAVKHNHTEAGKHRVSYTQVQVNKQCPQMSVREITELLDQNLPEANFVDAWYHSNTKNGREHGHRNCFVHVKWEWWMVYDPVRPFSWEKKGELRPIKDMLEYSNSLRFKELAY